MPGLTPIAGDLLEVRTACITPSQLSMNVMHFYVVTNEGGGMDIATAATQLEGRFAGDYKNLMPPTAAWRGLGVCNLMFPRSREATSTILAGPGLTGANLMPSQSSYLIKFNALPAGRRYQGRIYPGFISDANVADNGHLTIGGVAFLSALADLMFPAIVLTDDARILTIKLAIRHPNVIIGGIPTPQFSEVVAIAAGTKIATQKRRGQYGKTNTIPF